MPKLKKQSEAVEKAIKFKPTINISSKELPELKKWNLGEKHKIELEIEMVSKHKPDNFEIEQEKFNKDDEIARFEIDTSKIINK